MECPYCRMEIETNVRPYMAEGARYPSLIGYIAEGDEFETAYVRKGAAYERVMALEELVRDMNLNSIEYWLKYGEEPGLQPDGRMTLGGLPKWRQEHIRRRMRELGIEVE